MEKGKSKVWKGGRIKGGGEKREGLRVEKGKGKGWWEKREGLRVEKGEG